MRRGTAPDTRRPSQRWKATPPRGTALHQPHGTQPPTVYANQGHGAGPPHPHNRPHSTWVADPDSPPRGQAAGGGRAPELRRPSQRQKAPPPGTPFRHPHSAHRQLARAHAVGPVLGPHAHTNRTQDTRAAEPLLPAPKGGWPGEGQRLTPDAPHNGGRPSPPGTAPHQPRGTQPPTRYANQGNSAGPQYSHTRTDSRWVADPDSPPGRRAAGGGGAPELRRPSQRRKAGPPGDALMPAPQRASTTRKGARCGAGTGSPRPHQPHPGHTARGTPAARPKGQAAGGGTAPDSRRPSQRWEATLSPGTAPGHPRGTRLPADHASQGDSAGPPHPHTRAHSTWVADPDSPPRGRAAGEEERLNSNAPYNGERRLSRGRPLVTSTERNDGARCGVRAAFPGPHRPHPGDTGCGTPAARPKGSASGRGTSPDTRHTSQRCQATPPGDGSPRPPRYAAPHRACKPRGQCWAPTPAHPRPQHVGSGPGQPAQRAGSRGGGAPELKRPLQRRKAPLPGTPFCHQHSAQRRRTLWCRCCVPRPTPTAPGRHGLRNPGGPPQGLGVRERDSARHQTHLTTVPGHPPRGRPPTTPAVRSPSQGMQTKGTVLGPHTRTPARGWRTPTACPEGGQPGEEERLNSDAPHNGERHPLRGRPSANPTARNNGSQWRTLWGWSWVPTPTPTAPGTHGPRNPGYPPQRTGGRQNNSA